MQGSLEELTKEYQKQKEENNSSNFLLCYDIQPIALFEVYQVSNTELALTYSAEVGDFGIHLLMAPHKELLPLKKDINKISEKTLSTILQMLFSYPSVKRVVAEPDAQNKYACRLAEQAGMSFIAEIELTEKKAKLYMISKEQYTNQNCCN
jgi:penicillin amidase